MTRAKIDRAKELITGSYEVPAVHTSSELEKSGQKFTMNEGDISLYAGKPCEVAGCSVTYLIREKSCGQKDFAAAVIHDQEDVDGNNFIQK